jgi:hypothetical protein
MLLEAKNAITASGILGKKETIQSPCFMPIELKYVANDATFCSNSFQLISTDCKCSDLKIIADARHFYF